MSPRTPNTWIPKGGALWRGPGAAPLVFLALLSCSAPEGPPPNPHYVVGVGYQAGGSWYYPREDFAYDATGLAVVQAGAHASLTADGEAFDATALAAGHQTLQLPALAQVTNLENGYQIVLRINDRGPAERGRVIELTPRAAELLRARDGTKVRVAVMTAESRRMVEQLGGGQIEIEAAPREGVSAETLAPPAGASGSEGIAAHAAVSEAPAEASAPALPRLPEAIVAVPVAAGSLYVDAGHFGRVDYANQLRARLAGLPVAIERTGSRYGVSYRVLVGPLANVASADRTLDQVVHAGVTDARIVVE
jgi:rare lipoprotein A